MIPPPLPIQSIYLESEWLLPIEPTVDPMEPSRDLAVLAHAFRINRGRTLSVRGRPGEGGDGNAGRTYPSTTTGGQVDIQGSLCVALQVWCRGSIATEVVTPPFVSPYGNSLVAPYRLG